MWYIYSLYNENDTTHWRNIIIFMKSPNTVSRRIFCANNRNGFWNHENAVMKNYDEVLTILFGDYMTPVWGTQEHDYPFYKKQQELLEAYLKTNESDH